MGRSLQGYKDLKVFQNTFEAAVEIFHLSKEFPKEEKHSLTDQVRRSSGSVSTNTGKGFRKRFYPKYFVSKLSDPDAECAETLIHVSFSKDCGFLNEEDHNKLVENYLQTGKMPGSRMQSPENFAPKQLPSAS